VAFIKEALDFREGTDPQARLICASCLPSLRVLDGVRAAKAHADDHRARDGRFRP
jgi:hypothetical protein